ncbi:PKD domain-containing protein [Candidatus Bathyarchaeota archaeon]|nr:MAG: PKD domain-containing protein [Candidatus Bathyarchaeota archaeon]
MQLEKSRRLRRSLLAVTVLYVVVFAQVPFFTARSAPPPTVNFDWTPKSAVIGNLLNFNATATGGTPPYTYSWNFGDGQTGTGVTVLHPYNRPGFYSVALNVSDSSGAFNVLTQSVTIYDWPVRTYNWLIHWNATADDGFNIWDVSYKGVPLIRDARLAYVVNDYLENFCGPFQDETASSGLQGTLASGNLRYENFTTASDPYFQIRTEYPVGGYNYQEVFRFYLSGRWEPEILIGRGGCIADHIYKPMWRIDIVLGEDSNNFMSQYTPYRTWENLIWEGNYVDNGFRDPTHNAAQWRMGHQGMYYYMIPKIFRVDTDLPNLPTSIYLVRAHPNEIQFQHSLECYPNPCEDPSEFINGELAFRRDIAIWFIPRIWDHGPIDTTSPQKVATLSFYPGGSWP